MSMGEGSIGKNFRRPWTAVLNIGLQRKKMPRNVLCSDPLKKISVLLRIYAARFS